MTRVVDLRSDTVTRPGPAMRKVMANAEVGDDVYEEDPAINRLEAMAAELLGKEAALFVPSGTMGNLLALMTHCQPGDEVLLGRESHIVHYEVGGAARLANVMVNPLANAEDGSLSPTDVADAVREQNIHAARTRLLCLENTHNRCGGAAIVLETMDALTGVAHEHGLLVHLDGARIFNAAVALDSSAERIARDCDTVMFSLSKGLGCPVGSMLCGPREFVQLARRNRKLLGGGMRQAGILAAAAIYALEHHIERLADDHTNARRLAEGLSKFGVFRLNSPQTNIVIADMLGGSAATWVTAFAEEGVLAVPFGPTRLRMVTHLDVGADDIDFAIDAIGRAVEAVGG